MQRLKSNSKVPRITHERMVAAYDAWCCANPSASIYQKMDRWFLILRENGVGY